LANTFLWRYPTSGFAQLQVLRLVYTIEFCLETELCLKTCASIITNDKVTHTLLKHVVDGIATASSYRQLYYIGFGKSNIMLPNSELLIILWVLYI
jgi:hypothetical protein